MEEINKTIYGGRSKVSATRMIINSLRRKLGGKSILNFRNHGYFLQKEEELGDEIIQYGKLKMESLMEGKKVLWMEEEPKEIVMGAKEFDFLFHLAQHAEKFVNVQRIREYLYPHNPLTAFRTIKITLSNIKEKLLTQAGSEAEEYIKYVLSKGYTLQIFDWTPQTNRILSYGDVILNEQTNEVFIGGEKINISPSVFQALNALLEDPEKLLEEDDLVESFYPREINRVNIYISQLRNLLKNEMSEVAIEIFNGHGYRMQIKERLHLNSAIWRSMPLKLPSIGKGAKFPSLLNNTKTPFSGKKCRKVFEHRRDK